MKKTALISSALFLLPAVAFAQQGSLSNIRTLINSFGIIVEAFIPILIAATIVIFFWGLFKYVSGAGKGAGEGKNIMIAGIAALFIELSLFGIIQFSQNAVGIQNNATPQGVNTPPTVQIQQI